MTSLGPRLVVAGTHSGVGKTTVAAGLMAALRAAGHTVASAKVGPDFIDPGYHALATGRPPRNLDAWMSGLDLIAPLAARAGAGADVTIIEGVMGLFDGANDGSPSSTADIAIELDAPVILVVDGSSMSSSVAALVRGYRDHRPELRFAGVILNRVSTERHRTLLTEALDAIGVPVLGTLGRDDALTWRDRHLGLVPVNEQPDAVRVSLDRLGATITAGCDLERIMTIAMAAPEMEADPVAMPERVGSARIAVAGGPAFTFIYRDNIEALVAAGAELVPFDPLVDESLPPRVDGLVIGGGFPEVFAPRLADNRHLLAQVADAVGAGLVTWAECGGLLWLSESLDDRRMVGAIAARTAMADRLTLGYRTAAVHVGNPVASAGAELRGHEFHYSTCEPSGDALELTSRFGTRREGFGSATMLATYLHQHLAGRPKAAERFVRHCVDSVVRTEPHR
ncbi:MAG: cobyrinate a,c-diamide synthase [Actinomycetota bacterium]